MITDGTQPARKPLRIDFPCADLRPALFLHIPARIHPPVVQLELFLKVAVDVHDLVGLVGSDHFFVGPRAGGHELWWWQMAARSRQVMRDHPAAPEILAANPVLAFPEQQCHEGRADFFARQQFETRQFLSRANVERLCVVALKLGQPLPRPAHGQHDPLSVPLQVEVAQVGVRRAPAGRADTFSHIGAQWRLERPIVRSVCRRAIGMMQKKLTFPATLPRFIECLDVFEDGRVDAAAIGECCHPVDR